MKSIAVCLLLSSLAVCSQAGGQNYNISAPAGAESQLPKTAPAQNAQLVENYGKLPLSFEANTGQADNSVKFLSRGSGYALYLTGAEAVLALRKSDCAGVAAGAAQAASAARRPGFRRGDAGCKQTADVVRMRLAGASGEAPAPAGEERLPGKVNYFTGNDPAKWHTGVPNYAKVRYRGVYPGVDLVYYGNQRQLEYDFVVAAGADPKPIRLQFAGAKGLRLGADGDLVVTAPGGALAFHKPAVYQLVDGQRKPVEGRFAMLAKNTVGFRLGNYDRAKPLVIDPVLVYSTYLGGNVSDSAMAIAVDAAGNAYVTGNTGSPDFPVTPGAFQTTLNAGLAGDAFITKLNPSGSALVYSTYLGGIGYNSANAIAVDTAGNAYVAGYTGASDFPVTPGAFQTNPAANSGNAFIAKLNPTGSALFYSTYLGGTGVNWANAIAVDTAGNAYAAGYTGSADFPVTPGAVQTTNHAAASGGTNAFVAKLNPAGSALVYSTYLGGSGGNSVVSIGNSGSFGPGDEGTGLAVDGSGNAYITGLAGSTDFPVTAGAFQTTNRASAIGLSNVFVSKLNPAGSALVYSTYLGGSTFGDVGNGLAVDGAGYAYVAGIAGSTDFPVTPGAFQTTNHAGHLGNAFLTKLNPAGTALVYSTYLGGSSSDGASGVAVDGSGNAYISGTASSDDFPVTPGALQTTNRASAIHETNVFVSKLDPAGSTLVYSTYLGGTGYSSYSEPNGPFGGGFSTYGGDNGYGLAVDGSGNAYIAGSTYSTNFPVTQGAFQTTNNAQTPNNEVADGGNAFVAKLNLGGSTTTSPGPLIASGGIVPVDSTEPAIQPGEWVSIFGTNLASSTATWNGDFPTSLGGTTVTIDGNAAYLSYVSPGQINLQAPDDTATGAVPVVVTTGSGTATADVTLAQVAPSFLLFDSKHVAGIILRQDGSGAYGQGADSYDLLGPTGTSLGFPTVAAKAGDIVELFGTGFGPTTPAVPAGQAFSGAAPATYEVALQINNVGVATIWVGMSGAGLDQINLTIPAGLGTGDVPLVAGISGGHTPLYETPSYVVISLQ